MPDFYIRAWAEQTTFDCQDYRVTADTLEDATVKLFGDINKASLSVGGVYTLTEPSDVVMLGLERAAVSGDRIATTQLLVPSDRVTQPMTRQFNPQEVVDGRSGFMLLDEHGCPSRDLTKQVPVHKSRDGEPLEIDWLAVYAKND